MEGVGSWLSNLKLRTGYGVTGNDQIPAFSDSGVEAYESNMSLGSAQSPVSTRPMAKIGEVLASYDLS